MSLGLMFGRDPHQGTRSDSEPRVLKSPALSPSQYMLLNRSIPTTFIPAVPCLSVTVLELWAVKKGLKWAFFPLLAAGSAATAGPTAPTPGDDPP